jgi:hypothetical protein
VNAELTQSEPVDTQATVPSTQPTPEQAAYLAFVKKHHARCAQWARTHGNASFPILKLPDGSIIWLTREQRRRMEKRQRREFKKQARDTFLTRQLEIQEKLLAESTEP